MNNSGNMMHITSLQRDARITIFSYLHPKDVLAFSRTNKAARNLLGNNVEYGSDIIWYAILQHKQPSRLWMYRFGCFNGLFPGVHLEFESIQFVYPTCSWTPCRDGSKVQHTENTVTTSFDSTIQLRLSNEFADYLTLERRFTFHVVLVFIYICYVQFPK